MELFIRKMIEANAIEILNWKYEHPYDFYNNEISIEGLNELMNNHYDAVVDQNEQLIGFFCIGQAAQVPKGYDFGVYDEKLIDLGLGIKPELTGQGFGSQFLKFILNHIQEKTIESSVRLTVAKFNTRAINLYKKFSFEIDKEFYTDRADFITMKLGAGRTGKSRDDRENI